MRVNILFLIASIILCVTALAINFASSQNDDASLSPVAADVNILPAGPSAPTIVRFGSPIGLLAGPYQPTVGAVTPVHISVLMEDLNGNIELPGSPTYPVILNAPTGSNVLAGLYAPLSAPDPTMYKLTGTCIPVDCASLLTPPGVLGGISCDVGRESLQRAMICTTNLGPTDPPGNWRFSTVLSDSTGLGSPTTTSLTPGFPQTVTYNALTAAIFGTVIFQPGGGVTVTPENFLWTGLSSTGTNQISSQVTITNVGNVASSIISITGQNLVGVNIPTSTLNKNAFRVSTSSGGTPPAQCTTGVLLSGSPQQIPGAVLPYTQTFSLGLGTDTEIVYACIPNTPISSITGTLDTQYKTVVGQDWDITI
ncbi:MAG: hypothetical protein ACP5NS_03800 [Candidatus Pacearchaeota archaeon]